MGLNSGTTLFGISKFLPESHFACSACFTKCRIVSAEQRFLLKRFLRVSHQGINVPELKSILQSPTGWSTRDLSTFQALVDVPLEDTLTVINSRRYAGRWYARGVAQQQNCRKEIRARALKHKGFGLDICASYPSILSGNPSDVVRRRGSVCMLDETREMARGTKSWRAAVAK